MTPASKVETRAWEEQLAVDDESYRTQLAYLFERSAFYREKLGAAGIDSVEAAGALADIAQLPLTGKDELRATCTPHNPIGAHLCVTRPEIVRIYSTSGTTGTPRPTCSRSYQEAPMPSRPRPPESTSRVVTILASSPG